MNKRATLLLISVIIGAAALAGVLLCEKKIDTHPLMSGHNMTDDELLALPYFDLVAPKKENRNLPCDVESYSLGDGYIHLILPDNVSSKSVIVYVRDMDKKYIAKRVYDLTSPVHIGPWEIVLDHPSIPTMYFESEDPSLFDVMNAEPDSKGTICNGNVHLWLGSNDLDKKGLFREYFSFSEDRSSKYTASLQGRGNTSWQWSDSKKSYTLRFDKAQDLLGMGKNKAWNLIGNAFDPSLMKNVVFNRISKEAGIQYEPNEQNINLYVDGRYCGIYTLTTKIKAGKNRIALGKGDLLFRIEPEHQDQPILYEAGDWFESDDPDRHPVADLIYPENASTAEIEKASIILQRFYDALNDPGSYDISAVCDLESMARYYWIQEASMNFDAWENSVYIYYLRSDGKIHAGPVWDMDYTLGVSKERIGGNGMNHGVSFETPTGWKVREYGWYKILFENSDFVRIATDVYYNKGVRDAIFDAIPEFEKERAYLGEDAYLNDIFFGHMNKGITLDFGESYDEYCDNMIDFYMTRIKWIDSNMHPLSYEEP